MSRSFGSPSQHASRSGLSLLHASASYCPTQFPKVLPPIWPNQISCAGQMKFATRCLKIQFSLFFLGEVIHHWFDPFVRGWCPKRWILLLQGSPSALSEMMAANVRQKKDDWTTWSAAAVAVLGSFILIQWIQFFGILWTLATHPAPSTTPFLQIKAWEMRALSGFILCCDLAGVADLKTGTMIVEP